MNTDDDITLADLADVPQWVAWRNEERGGKTTKVPYFAQGRKAEADDPSTWLVHDDAVMVAQTIVNGTGGGVGIELGQCGEYWLAGVDFDSCRDANTGEITPWAQAVMNRIDTYVEISPSGTGVKAYLRIDPAEIEPLRTIMGTQHGRQFKRANGSGAHPPAIEFYTSNRYFATTWQGLGDAPAELRVIPLDDLRWLIEVAGPELSGKAKAEQAKTGDSDSILDRLNTAATNNRSVGTALRHASTMHGGSRSEGAFGLGGALRRAGWSFVDMKAALLACPATSGWAAENASDDRQFIRIWGRIDNKPPPPPNTAPDVGRPPEFTDEALALRFAALHKDRLRYVANWGRWLIWDGAVWRSDNTLQAFDLSRAICRQAAGECNEPRVAVAIASAKTVAAVERLAKADRRHAATVDQWDADPWLLNTPGGVVDLLTGQMRDHRPDDYMTNITAVSPGGDCPLWDKFLARITNDDRDLQAFLYRFTGYGLTGITDEHAMAFGYGTGSNGKGVFLNTMTNIMGGYAVVAPMETFTASQGDRHSTDLAMLRGARLVAAQETEEGRRWAESRIKALTGGDPITARFMRQDFFTFTPQFKLFIAGNHKPGLRSINEAIRRRLNLIPFIVTILAAERDPKLAEKLQAEWPGILKRMIIGCLDWQRQGLAAPESVTTATGDYLEAEDTIGQWIAECCIVTGQIIGDRPPVTRPLYSTTAQLFDSWKAWAEKAGEFVPSMKRFSQTIHGRGFVPKRQDGKGKSGFLGIEVGSWAP
jgi:putative DNA primase/helicase